jgi:hypothetical protein
MGISFTLSYFLNQRHVRDAVTCRAMMYVKRAHFWKALSEVWLDLALFVFIDFLCGIAN